SPAGGRLPHFTYQCGSRCPQRYKQQPVAVPRTAPTLAAPNTGTCHPSLYQILLKPPGPRFGEIRPVVRMCRRPLPVRWSLDQPCPHGVFLDIDADKPELSGRANSSFIKIGLPTAALTEQFLLRFPANPST